MKIRILAGAATAALALTTGLAALPAGAAAPTATTAYDQGSMGDRGTCTGLMIGTYANDTKTAGLNATNQIISFSGKGVPSSSADATALPAPIVGACSLQQRLGVTGAAVNFGGIFYVNKNVTKVGLKLTSKAVDCYDADNESDTAERPLTGKLSFTYSDLTKTDAYVRTQGQDRGAGAKVDVTWYTGIVAKGEAVGATIGGNAWVNPIVKDKLATAYFNAGATYSGPDLLSPPATETRTSLAPGYGYSPSNAVGNGIACQTGTNNGGSVTLGLVGAGGVSPSLSSTSAGWKFLI